MTETKPQDLTKTDLEALARFRYVLRKFLRFSEDAASKVGLSPQQHQALLATKGFPGRDRVIVGELAERLQIRHHSTASLIDRLVAMNLLQREVDTKDRRKVWISLTPEGDELILKLSAAHTNELLWLGPQLTELISQFEKRFEGSEALKAASESETLSEEPPSSVQERRGRVKSERTT